MNDDVAKARALLRRGAGQARRASRTLAAAADALEKASGDATALSNTVESVNHTKATDPAAKE